MPPRTRGPAVNHGVDDTEEILPLAEEVLSLTKRLIETGRVQVRLSTETRNVSDFIDLTSERVVVERVPFGHVVTEIPIVREVDGVMIVPVVEEVLVKQLVLREELHIRRVVEVTRVTETHALRQQTATITRLPPQS